MNDQAKQYQQIIAKCWADEAFKQQLMADPAGTLKQEGMDIPEGMTIQMVENNGHEFYLLIPPPPTDLSDEALAAVAGGLLPPPPPLGCHFIPFTNRFYYNTASFNSTLVKPP